MVLCRECDRLLLRTHVSCPSCRARRPGAHLRPAARPHRLELWVLAPAVSAAALAGGDAAVRWLLGPG